MEECLGKGFGEWGPGSLGDVCEAERVEGGKFCGWDGVGVGVDVEGLDVVFYDGTDLGDVFFVEGVGDLQRRRSRYQYQYQSLQNTMMKVGYIPVGCSLHNPSEEAALQSLSLLRSGMNVETEDQTAETI